MSTRSLRRNLLFFPLLLFAVATEAQEVRWYHSNRDYMVLDPAEVVGPEAPESGWYISSSESEGVEERTLYLNGVARGREELTLDATGRVLSRRRIGMDGAFVFEERYRFRPDGSLRGVERCDAAGECVEIRYDGIGEELTGSEIDIQYRYDDSGRPTSELRNENGDDRLVRRYEYEGNLLVATTTTHGDRETIERFENGLTVARIERRSGRLVSEERFEYDAEERVLLRELRERLHTTVESYTYPEEGGSLRELVLDDVLGEREVIAADGTTTIERFSGGELVSRTVLVDGRITRRETWLNGRLVSVERELSETTEEVEEEVP